MKLRENLTQAEIGQCYDFAKSSRDVDGLQQVAIVLANECERLRRLTILLKTELAGGKPPEPITIEQFTKGATILPEGGDA